MLLKDKENFEIQGNIGKRKRSRGRGIINV